MTKEEVMKMRNSASKNEFDFEKDLSIDAFNLDKECISHAVLYFRYADAMREAKAKVSLADDKLKLVIAERNIALREEFTASGKKFTEAVITAELEKDPIVINAKRELRAMQDMFGKISVAVQAMEARKSQLDNLVKLHCAGYFASKPVSNQSEMEDSITTEASNNYREYLNK